jgi:hypothetical protein
MFGRSVIQGALSLVSVPVKELTADNIDPAAWGAEWVLHFLIPTGS